MSRSNARRFRRLGVEHLETRELLAGDLCAAALNGSLYITGGSQSNGVQITSGPTTGTVQVQGLRQGGAETKVNHLLGPQIFRVDHDLVLSLGDGNNRVQLQNFSVPGDLTVSLGGDNDSLVVQGLSTASINVDTGRGTDSASVQDCAVSNGMNVQGEAYYGAGKQFDLSRSQVGGALSIATGNGPDIVNLSQITAESAVIATDAGHDTVTINDSTVRRDLSYSALGGQPFAASVPICKTLTLNNDVVGGVLSLVTGKGRINSAAGDDSVSVRNVAADSLTIDVGRGWDDVRVRDSHTAGTMNVQGEAYYGAGKFFDLANVAVGGALTVTTGDGPDCVNLTQVSAARAAIESYALPGDRRSFLKQINLTQVTLTGDLSISTNNGRPDVRLSQVITGQVVTPAAVRGG